MPRRRRSPTPDEIVRYINNREEVILDLRVQLSQAEEELEASKAYTQTVARAWARVAVAIREQVASGKLEIATLEEKVRESETEIRKAKAKRKKTAKGRSAAGKAGGIARRENRLWDAKGARVAIIEITKGDQSIEPGDVVTRVMSRIRLNPDGGPHPRTVSRLLEDLWIDGKLSWWSPPPLWVRAKKSRKINK
jgi:hypothetical protein